MNVGLATSEQIPFNVSSNTLNLGSRVMKWTHPTSKLKFHTQQPINPLNFRKNQKISSVNVWLQSYRVDQSQRLALFAVGGGIEFEARRVCPGE